jgi:hypothetical protein
MSYCENKLYYYERFREIKTQCSDDSFTATQWHRGSNVQKNAKFNNYQIN